MADFNMKQEYERLSKRHNLPSFSKIDEDFELSFIEKEFHLLKAIRRRMNEKVIFFCRILEGILFPNPQFLPGIHESKAISDEEKKELMKIYKKLMIYERKSLQLDISHSEKGCEDYINSLFNDWPSFKKPLKDLTNRMLDVWKREEQGDNKDYFG